MHAPYTLAVAMRDVLERRSLVFVCDVADDLFEQVFDRHQAGDAAIFINDDSHVLLLSLHLTEQFVALLCFRDKTRGTRNRRDRMLWRLCIWYLQQVVCERDADNIVDTIPVNRNAGKRPLLQS